MDKESTSKKRRHSEEQEEKDAVDRDNSEERENIRSITLDMSKYSPDIQADIQRLTESEFVQIFNIGFAVKQSFTLTVCENNEVVKKKLESQMQPICKKMDDIQSQVKKDVTQIQAHLNQSVSIRMNNFTNKATTMKTDVLQNVATMKSDLVGQVQGVCRKVQPIRELEDRVTTAITSSEKSVLNKIDEYKGDLNKLTKQMYKPAIIGSVGESTVISILKKYIPNYTFDGDVSKQKGKGDIHVQTPDDHHFLVEIKNYTTAVPKPEINKFERDVASSHQVKVGLMFSLKSGISTKSKESRKFQVDVENEKYLIYVPNALVQEEIMAWSVLLANELAGMDVQVKDGQKEKLQKLSKHFQEKIKDVKKCRDKMKALKDAMEDLENNVEPILQTIQNAKKEINSVISYNA